MSIFHFSLMTSYSSLQKNDSLISQLRSFAPNCPYLVFIVNVSRCHWGIRGLASDGISKKRERPVEGAAFSENFVKLYLEVELN